MVRNKKKLLQIVCVISVLFVVKDIIFSSLIPPFQAPDEPGHVEYVRYLIFQKSFPDELTFIGEQSMNNALQKKSLTIFNTKTYQPTLQIPNIASAPPLYYVYEIPFYLMFSHYTSWWILLGLRIGSIILGTITIIFFYKLLRLLFSSSILPALLGTILFALQPMFVFITSVVNSDNLMNLFFLLFLYFSTRFLLKNKSFSTSNIVLLGSIISLASVTKPQLMIFIPLGFVALYLAKNKKIINYLLLFIFSSILPLLWYIPNLLFQGFSSLTYTIISTHQTHYSLWEYPLKFLITKQPIGIFMSFWGFFGWLSQPLPKWIYVLFAVTFIPIIFFKKEKFSSDKQPAVFFIFLTSLTYVALILLYDIINFAKTSSFVIQGRYLLPLFPLYVVLLLQSIFSSNKTLQKILIGIILMIFLLAQWEMYVTLRGF